MNSQIFKETIISEIEKTNLTNNKIGDILKFIYTQINGAFLEIKGNVDKNFNVSFEDDQGNIVYQTELKTDMWSRLNAKYFKNYTIKIQNDDYYNEIKTDLKDKRIYITLESKSLGDTLAWVPYVDEFRKKHSCDIVLSTFMNDLFKEQYPEIEFVEPGTSVDNIFGMFNIGWFYNQNDEIDYSRHPNNFRTQPLQKTASDILGLDYEEIRPKLKLKENVKKEKKVGIAIHGTAQSKYWNNPTGWQEVVDYLIKLGYEVVLYSVEPDGYMGNFHPTGIKNFPRSPLQEVIYDLQSCEFFIGIGSGLSWLAWSVGLPTILISGFSEEYTETKSNTYRVINNNVCTGCFNSHRLNPSDWNWCPIHKNTERQFECSKSINSKLVISKIKQIGFNWGFFDSDQNFKKLVEEELFVNNIYEKYFNIKDGDIVMDIGASVGPFVKSLCDRKLKKVYAIEPSKTEFNILEENISNKNVVLVNKAIGNTNQTNCQLDEVYGDDKSVDYITFDKLLEDYKIDKIDFLKLDCEGGEYDIFTNENLKFLKQIPKIVGEWHLNDPTKKEKFFKFKNEILSNFSKFTINSVDGYDITQRINDQNFIEYYSEILIYIENN